MKENIKIILSIVAKHKTGVKTLCTLWFFCVEIICMVCLHNVCDENAPFVKFEAVYHHSAFILSKLFNLALHGPKNRLHIIVNVLLSTSQVTIIWWLKKTFSSLDVSICVRNLQVVLFSFSRWAQKSQKYENRKMTVRKSLIWQDNLSWWVRDNIFFKVNVRYKCTRNIPCISQNGM